jgi:hypothetical protein
MLREIVKFRTYVDCLTVAQNAKDSFYAARSQAEAAKRGDEAAGTNQEAEAAKTAA